MASPRTMWSGSLSLGLLNVPVTVGKSWMDGRESSLVTVCEEHAVPIDRTERCGAGHKDCGLTKRKGVAVGDELWEVIAEDEYRKIEDATRSDLLEVLDCQPCYDLPLEFGTGTYYLRPDKGVKGSERPFAILSAALGQTDFGLVVKWCRSARQRLAVIHHFDGVLLLTTIPFMSEFRPAGDQEKTHHQAGTDAAHVAMTVKLLHAMKAPEFAYASYMDNGLLIRADAVNHILEGNEPIPSKQADPAQQVQDLMATLEASMAAVTQ